jgi:quercetin dioxygenase-like cupin family protein
MNKTLLIVALVISIFFTLAVQAQVAQDSTNRGDKGSPNYFTGTVWIKEVANQATPGYSVYKVVFDKGARTNWHTHPNKQVIVIVDGSGYLKEKNKPVRTLQRGDVVDVAGGVSFWIGAAPDQGIEQIVINPIVKANVSAVDWLEKVTDEEYKGAARKPRK